MAPIPEAPPKLPTAPTFSGPTGYIAGVRMKQSQHDGDDEKERADERACEN